MTKIFWKIFLKGIIGKNGGLCEMMKNFWKILLVRIIEKYDSSIKNIEFFFGKFFENAAYFSKGHPSLKSSKFFGKFYLRFK